MKSTISTISIITGGALLAAAGAPVQAQEITGRVLSSTPVVQQVQVPRQICSVQPVAVQRPSSGAGAVIGALAGGILGNTVGGGGGRAAATALGAVGGAVVGDRVEGGGYPQVQNMQQCSTQTYLENRTVGYTVTYEYAGRQYSVQMPNDPGPTVRLQVTPMSGGYAQTDGYATADAQPAVVAAPVPAVVYGAAPVVYPAYYGNPYYGPSPYYSPIGISLGFGFISGGHGHGHHR
jgi:uncharacterized protein YcfJ